MKRRNVETFKKNQMELLEVKNTIHEIKNVMDMLNSRLDPAEEKKKESENKAMETMQTEAKERENCLKN